MIFELNNLKCSGNVRGVCSSGDLRKAKAALFTDRKNLFSCMQQKYLRNFIKTFFIFSHGVGYENLFRAWYFSCFINNEIFHAELSAYDSISALA